MKRNFLKIIVVIAVFISIMYITRKSMMKSRGMKNNNPFNMNQTDDIWLGMIESSDERFCAFKELKYGIRAGLINLFNAYFVKRLTLRQIIYKYAPPEDGNDTEAYLKSVVQRTNIIPEQIPDKTVWLKLAEAILYHENGFVVMAVPALSQVVSEFKLLNYA